MNRRRRLGRFAQRENVRRRAITQPPETRLDLREHRRGQPPPEILTEERVVVVLVAEPGRILKEIGHRFLDL
jgi:hypothetical protein